MKEMKLDRHEFNLLVNDILLDVKPVKLRISIANRLIEFFDKKQERIAELEDRWQKLKEWIKEQNNPIDNLVISDDETKYLYMSDILDEMEELDKGK